MSLVTDAPLDVDTTRYAGRIVDVDSHEMVTLNRWPETFGWAGEQMQKIAAVGGVFRASPDGTDRPDILGDNSPIDYDGVWNVKGPAAPSAIDLSRRPAVMDLQGFDRQLVFPSFALTGMIFLADPAVHLRFKFDPAEFDRVEIGRAVVAAHNKWAAAMTRSVDGRRMRIVGIVLTDTIEQMMADTEAALADGVRAIWIPASNPPADTSPGDRALDPFYRLLAEARVPLISHLGTEVGILASRRWSANCPEFAPSSHSSLEFPLQPYNAATMHLGQENLLIPMVYGGVFERHPDLRFGVIECGAEWFGGFAESLDLWSRQFTRLDATLRMKPSEYLNRNVRITPFVFEPVDTYFDRYPHLSDTFCYSSDFPHREGGVDSLRRFANTLASVDETIREKFFVTNGGWLLPE